MITTGQKTAEEPNKMSVIYRIRILRVRKGYSDYLIITSTSSCKRCYKKVDIGKSKSEKLIKLIKVLKILRCTMENKPV